MRGKKKRLARVAAVVMLMLAIAYLGISAVVANQLWHPTRRALTTTPERYGLPYEDVQFTSMGDNIPLSGWFIDSPGRETIVLMHGSGSIRDNYISMEVSKVLFQHNYDLFLFDFRGHGTSGGQVGSIGLLETRDVAGALAYLKGRGVAEVGTLAYSMGAATGLLAAPNHPEMRAIVVDSPFADLYSIMEGQRAKTGMPPSFFNPGIILMSQVLYGINPMHNQPREAMARLSDRPILLIHSTVDDLIPVSNAYELQKAGASNPNLEVWIAPASSHVAVFAEHRQEYLDRLIRFFDKQLLRK
jgi:pimeloyl-ACP methyl ester carboxylesterase